MEKRDGRFIITRYGRLLILLCILLASALPLAAVDVGVFISSYEIAAGESLTMEFTIPDTDPADASLSPSGIPESFIGVSSRKERRQIADALFPGGMRPVTVICQEWTASQAGSFSLGPFSVKAGDETITLPQVYITVTSKESLDPSALRWVMGDALSGTGRSSRLTLEAQFSGTVRSISCPAPENALLEEVNSAASGKSSSDLSEGSESGWVRIATYNWTPLSSGLQNLPVAVFIYADERGSDRKLSSPVRATSVVRLPVAVASTSVPGSVARAFTASSGSSESDRTGTSGKSSSSGRLVFPAECKGIPWEAGHYADILAILRHAEYTRLFPREYRISRLAAEERLGLEDSLDVPPAAWKPWGVFGAVILFTLAFLLKISGWKPKLFRRFIYLLFFTSGLLVIFAVYVYTRSPGMACVSRGSDLLHVPEGDSTVVDRIPEGAALLIKRRVGNWAYVETPSSFRDGFPPTLFWNTRHWRDKWTSEIFWISGIKKPQSRTERKRSTLTGKKTKP